MARKIKIEFERGGKFVATLFDEEAPKTCNFVWNLLPLDAKAVRVVASGELISIPAEGTVFNKLEYVNTTIPPGEIGFLTTFFPHRPMNKPYTQILLAFGKNEVHQMWGIASPVNRFAKITEGIEQLTEVAMRIAEKGVEKVTIKRKQ